MKTNGFMKQYRCVIHKSYYLKWHHYTDNIGRVRTGDKYAIQPCGSEVTYLEGLYLIKEMHDFKYCTDKNTYRRVKADTRSYAAYTAGGYY